MKASSDLLVLAALERGEAHGGELAQRLRRLDADARMLFPVVRRLEAAGLVRGRRSNRRRIYALTVRGKSSLKEQRALTRILVRAVERIAAA